jgi:hypothetical protein
MKNAQVWFSGETEVTYPARRSSIFVVSPWTERLLTKRRAVDFCRVATALCCCMG